MHAILISFRPEASEEAFMQEVGPKMMAMKAATPGLVMKTFIESDPKRWAGFYLFTTKESADAYLAGEFFQWFSKLELLSKPFSPSALTRKVGDLLAARARRLAPGAGSPDPGA